jgi:hypothetical protein
MIAMMAAVLLVLGQTATPAADSAFEKAVTSCGVDGERMRAIVREFELTADQAIAEFQPSFVLSDCIADAVRGRGRFVAVVDAGNRVEQAVGRAMVQKRIKRDVARYGDVALIQIKPGKALPAEQQGNVDRVLIVGTASDLLADRKRGLGLLRGLSEMAKTGGLFGVVDVPDKRGVDVENFVLLAREAGWEAAGQTSTGPDGLLLLKFRKV